MLCDFCGREFGLSYLGLRLALGPCNNGCIGNLDKALLNNIRIETLFATQLGITELLHFAFELMFAAITPALIVGHFPRVL
jgi:ammonia channel protein AmtB